MRLRQDITLATAPSECFKTWRATNIAPSFAVRLEIELARKKMMFRLTFSNFKNGNDAPNRLRLPIINGPRLHGLPKLGRACSETRCSFNP